METNVFINDREACSKACDGVSAAAFPDPCWTPPAPPVVVPYPNTAKASSLQKGTTSVFICGSMVAKEDVSYFSTSTGDEGATQGMPKGVATGVIKGKAYFISWSPNVKFEGRAVPRHEDLMTHNHGSPPGNTPPNVYMNNGKIKQRCADEIREVQKHCKSTPLGNKNIEEEAKKSANQKDNIVDEAMENNNKKGKNPVSKLVHGIQEKLKKEIDEKVSLAKKSQEQQRNNSADTKHNNSEPSAYDWINYNCDGLWVKPTKANAEKVAESIKNAFEDFKNKAEHLDDALKNIDLRKIAENMVSQSWDALKEKGVAYTAEKVGKKFIPGVGWVDFGLDTVMYSTEADRIYNYLNTIIETLGITVNDLKNDILNGKPIPIMATTMRIIAKLNPCIIRRRCLLVKYSETTKENSYKGKGCCPGQTGHHLIPGAMAKKCPNYSHSTAPTICVEGVGNSDGTHGAFHNYLKKRFDKMKKAGMKSGLYSDGGVDNIRDVVIDSVKNVFPESHCSWDCLRTQLDEFYESCKFTELPLNDGFGSQGTTDESENNKSDI